MRLGRLDGEIAQLLEHLADQQANSWIILHDQNPLPVPRRGGVGGGHLISHLLLGGG